MKGYTFDKRDLSKERLRKLQRYFSHLSQGWQNEYIKYDLLLQYKETIPLEEQDAIWEEVGDELERMDMAMRKVAAKRSFSAPAKRS